MIADILPVPVLVSPTPETTATESNGEARESTPATRPTVGQSDSRGGQKTLVKMPNGGFRPSRPKRVDLDAAYYREYRKKKSAIMLERDATRRRRDRNKKWVVQTVTGLPDVEKWNLLSDFQVDVAMRYFWGKRGMKPPVAGIGGITGDAYVIDHALSITKKKTRSADACY